MPSEKIKALAMGLCDFEREMIRGKHDGSWGAAIGAAVESLRGRGLYVGFSRTPLAEEVARYIRDEH